MHFKQKHNESTNSTLPNRQEYLYIHVHKAGGTSMKFTKFQSSNFSSVDIYYHSRRSEDPDRFRRKTTKWIQRGSIAAAQKQTASPPSRTAHIFSFVRDPAVRFLSGVGQVLSMDSRRQKLMPCVPYLSQDERPVEFIRCVLDKMQGKLLDDTGDRTNNHNMNETRFDFLDLHMLPQVYELYDGVLERDDVPIHLIDLANLDTFCRVAGAKPPKVHVQSRTIDDGATARNLQTPASDGNEHGSSKRDTNRRFLEEWKAPKLSPREIFFGNDTSILLRVCSLYDMDVKMLLQMQQLGVQVPSLCTT
ncbi:sulfotransferase family protein [Nitzschia inconspicua]|uniref:Sulfotransferase family protein n=1 Tax=Nitzschia inconspicua TaxID=303405 RepID=A0A9K3LBS0_9STRA|nr:sulfotransferase family protein [Nitzschia inconspicua]KAG7359374.1 sulfotransferase family protein [Nitzschia inconspicua]